MEKANVAFVDFLDQYMESFPFSFFFFLVGVGRVWGIPLSLDHTLVLSWSFLMFCFQTLTYVTITRDKPY